MKKILIIVGHPGQQSFCHSLADVFYSTLKSQNFEIEILDVSKLNFDPILRWGAEDQVMEPDLLLAQEKIKLAEHIVFVYPNWWGNPPALLKGFIDRVFSHGFAFQYGNAPFPDKLLVGKTSEIILTLDTPEWFYRFFMSAPGLKIMARDVLAFCGVKNLRSTLIGPIRGSSEEKKLEYLNKVKKLASSNIFQ